MSVTKDSTFAAMADEKYKVTSGFSGVRSGRLVLTNAFLEFSFYQSLYFEYVWFL